MEGFNLEDALFALIEFRKNRDWEKYHTPKNLSMSIAIEAAELMEHFQWTDSTEPQNSIEERLSAIKDEIADTASYLLLLSHDLGIDLNKAVLDKIKKNEEKYPVDKCKGKYEKYDRL